MIKITNLVENNLSENKALRAEHGLSFFVETDKHKILFDCGPSDVVLHNARYLGVDLKSAECAILSHNHWDHTIGYREVVEAGKAPSVLYTGPDFFQKKYAQAGIRYTDLSCGFNEDFLVDHGITHLTVDGTIKLDAGLWLMTGFERTHDFETIPDRFVKEVNGEMVVDDFSDEVCMVMETEKGLIVLVGCSHPGILNIIASVHKRLGKPVYGVIGGTHLMEADGTRIEKTLEELQALGIQICGLCHCSGTLAREEMDKHENLAGCQIHVGGVLFLK